MEGVDGAEVFPGLEMAAGQDRDDFHVGLRLEKALDSALEDRASVQQQKLLGQLSTHPGAAAAGHENSVNFSAHNHRFLSTKLRIFI
jgi:hypothetical protein